MVHLTLALPDEVAQTYYHAAETLKDYLQTEEGPDAKTLMRFLLAGFTADEIATRFDRALRNLTGAPMPDEAEWIVADPTQPQP